MSVGGNKCALRAMHAGEQDFHEEEQSVVRLNLGNLRGRVIVETKKVLVMCESCFGEVCKCFRMFANI